MELLNLIRRMSLREKLSIRELRLHLDGRQLLRRQKLGETEAQGPA